MPELLVRPWHQVGEPALLPGFPHCDSQRAALTRIAVPADLKPRLLALMPAQQHLAAARVDDQRGRRDMEGNRAQPGVIGGLDKDAHALDIGSLGPALRPITLEQVEDRAADETRGRHAYSSDEASGSALPADADMNLLLARRRLTRICPRRWVFALGPVSPVTRCPGGQVEGEHDECSRGPIARGMARCQQKLLAPGKGLTRRR